MASAPEKTDWVCPEKEDRGGEECGGGGKSEKERLRRQEGENQKDKDGEISGETEDSWQRRLRFCSHAARCQLLFGHKREKTGLVKGVQTLSGAETCFILQSGREE